MNDELPWTVAEVARYLRIDRESVYRLCLSGKLTAYKPAGQWRIWKKDVLAYLESKKHQPARIPAAVARPSAGASAGQLDRLRAMGVRI